MVLWRSLLADYGFSGATASTKKLWHYPATITNKTIAKEIARFEPAGPFTTDSTAAIINTFGDRQQMVFFTSWATNWSLTSNYLQHAYIHWMTRGLCKCTETASFEMNC